jgi:phosphatidylinositol 4-kinase A
MIKRHCETTNLALMILRGCGNIQKRIHKTCLQFIKLILTRERGLEGCSSIWTGLLDKLELLYKTCRAEMGVKPDPELLASGDFIKDPEYAREAFEDVLKFSREVFQTASYLYPHEYYSFVMNYFQSGASLEDDIGNVSYRNVSLLELLKSCHPDSNYFSLPLEMHRNSESHFKWHLLLPKLRRESHLNIPDSNLKVEYLWSNRKTFSTDNIKNMMTFINHKVLLSSGSELVDFDKLRCLVHLPFLHSDHSLMQLACKLWMLMFEKMPSSQGKSLLLLSELISAYRHHRAHKLGIFESSEHDLDPFKTKMTSTPSKQGKLELGQTVSTFYLYLVDFLRERFMIDSRDQHNSLNLYISLAQELLDSTLEFKFHGWSRAARFRIVLFVQEIVSFVRNFWSDRFGSEIYKLKAGVYRCLIDFFESPKSWSIQSRDLLEYEVRTNSALIDYIDRDSVVPTKFSEKSLMQNSLDSMMFSRSSYSVSTINDEAVPAKASQLTSPTHKTSSVVTLRQLLKYFLIHENECIQVWMGTIKTSKMTLPPRAFWREMAAFAREYSPELAIRFCRMVKMEPDGSLIVSTKGSPKRAFLKYLGSVSILEYFISSGLEVLNLDCFLFADPISPPLALAIFRTLPYKTTPKYLNYAMRSLEAYPPELLFFYIPQIVQNLRHDENGYTETTIMHIASVSSLFAHQVIWNMMANMYIDDAGTVADSMKPTLDAMVSKIVSQFQGSERIFYEREFSFFEKVTGISGLLKPFIKKEKWEKKKKIDEELAKIEVDPGVYLPSNPESCVVDIDYSSGRPLQSFAKVSAHLFFVLLILL